MVPREGEEGGFAVELALDVIAALGRHRVPLVDGDDEGAARLEDVAGEVGVLLGDALLASKSSTTTLASSIACIVLITENFSTASSTLPRRRTPAVSISTYWRPLRSKSR